jgi:hypothetical protein
MRQFYLIFNNFAIVAMNKFDLSYQILTGKERELLADKNLIETARWLEEKGLVLCTHGNGCVQAQLNLEGIDAWMQNKLNELHVDWKLIQSGIYGIETPSKEPAHMIEDDQDVFFFCYKSLFIVPLYKGFTHQPKNVIIQFADIFCENVDMRRLIRTVATGKEVEFVLEWINGALYLNKQRILTKSSKRQKAIIQILIDEQNSSKYISFDEIAERIEHKDGLRTDDIHDQIYKPINILQSNVRTKFPKLTQGSNFIEIGKASCRLNASVWVKN